MLGWCKKSKGPSTLKENALDLRKYKGGGGSRNCFHCPLDPAAMAESDSCSGQSDCLLVLLSDPCTMKTKTCGHDRA